MGSESLDEVGTILRSILTSEKNGIPLRKLEGEYRTLTGNRIPYRNLGFNTLEEYLGSIPDTVRLQRNYDGEMLVHVVVTESTAHVAQMVRGQKSAKPRTATRTAYRRPMSQNQSAYRPNRILSKYSSSTHRTAPSYTYKAAPPTTGVYHTFYKRRPGYELYHPPAQRSAQPNFARQQPPSSAFGWPKKEQSPVVRNNDVTRSENKPPNSNFSAFASGGFQRSSFEKPPRFLKTSQLSSSSSSSISSLSNDEGGGARAQQQQQQGAVTAPVATTKAAGVAASAAAPLRTSSEQTGWRQLDSSWSRSTPAVTTPPAGASRAAQPAAATGGGGGLSGGWNGGGGGRGDTGTTATAQLWGTASKKPAAETQITAAGDTGWRDDQLATDGWGEPAQPIPTSTAVKSLGWSDPSPVQATRPLATPAKPLTPTEHRPVTIEPGQPRFDPFRSPTLAGSKPAWIEPAQERFDPFRSPVPIGQLKLDLSTPAEPKLAGIEPGQQRFDPFKSTALPNATTFGSSFASAAPTMGADAPRAAEPRFDPFRQPLRLDAIIPSQPPKPVAKSELGINLASSSTPAVGLCATPQPPAAASLQTPTAAPALRVATEFAPQLATTFAPLRRPGSFDMPTTQLVEEPIPPTPNCQLVREYAQREGLAHSYTTMLHTHKRPHGAPPMWLAVLRLGDVKIPSFPNEMPTPDEAKEAAAACAVAKLRIEGKLSAHRVTPASNPEEVALLVTRIAQVVLSKPNGLVKEGVKAAYEERFYEQLPPYWLEHVAKSGLVHIDSGTQCILYPLEPKNVVQRERAPSIDKDDRSSSASNSSGEPSQSATDYVDIFVTCVTSTDSVFFRFVDYDDQYHDLLEAMALHYGTGDEARVVSDLMEGHLYVTLYDDAWMRVQLVARQGNGKAECYFVDEGTVVVLDEASLVHLEDEFAVLPMQAIQCQLDGLAQHAQCDGIADIVSEVLLGKSLVAEVTRREEPIMVVVYDTWGSEDVDLNSEIFRRLTRVGLPEKGCVGKTLLGHVRADGVVWLQPNAPGMREMHDFEEALNNYCQTNPAMEEEPVMDTLYACQCRQDGRFYRAVLTSPNPLPSGEFEVLFVDFGGESRAFLAEFRNIDCLGNPVMSLPRQAVKCRLRGVTGADGITWSETATAKLLSLAGKGTELLVRVAEPASYMEPALVELFKRHEQSRDLVSVNDTLAESLRSTPSPAALLGQR